MAIELLQGPLNGDDKAAGLFSLPPGFDTKRFAAKWVKSGNAVKAAQEREHILGTRMTADGWGIWKSDGAAGKPYSVNAASGEYILLCRPREIQEATNAIYGNVGKERMLQEKRGETTGGVPVTEPGILGDEQLARVIGREDQDDGQIVFNTVRDISRVSQTPIETKT